MTHIRKAAILCDRCGARIDIDPDVASPFSSSILHRESAWRDWIEVENGRHLCPECAGHYREVKRRMERELREAAGVRTIDFDY